jgi:predicted nucleic acid-binding protein
MPRNTWGRVFLAWQMASNFNEKLGMSGADKILADTNTLIYLDSGNREVASLLQDKEISISFITEIELLGFPQLGKEKLTQLETMIASMFIIEMSGFQKKIAIELKRKRKLKTPDAIIAAAAIEKSIPILTADKIFTKIPELQCILFEV